MTPSLLLTSLLTAAFIVPPPAAKPSGKLPMCGLPPAKILPNLCIYKYRISTQSPGPSSLTTRTPRTTSASPSTRMMNS